MGYDHGDRFPSDFDPNGTPFGSKSKGKLSPRSYPVQSEKKCKHSFLIVGPQDNTFTELSNKTRLSKESSGAIRIGLHRLNFILLTFDLRLA